MTFAKHRIIITIALIISVALLTFHYLTLDERKFNISIKESSLQSSIKSQSHAIMPQLKDENAKKELGNASWKLFHTMLGRFPENPSLEDRKALSDFIHLFARLYPCGQCSEHAIKMFQKYPPQTSSRTAAAMWGCYVHNLVNVRLGKLEFDCTTVMEHYKCGCDDEK